MCGIVGFLAARNGANADTLRAWTEDSCAALAHRGPDDAGVWINEEAGVALGHRRLAVLDLSPAGHQPMDSADGRYVIVYNGEIYNFRALRDELAARGAVFTTESDTEVLLAGIVTWGVAETLRRANGMFAFGLWDRKSRELTLARDRFGQKPLYYGDIGGGVFGFASELKAFRAHPNFMGVVNQGALALFLRHNNVPAPHCIYDGLSKLPPGCIVTVSADGVASGPAPYWQADAAANAAHATPFTGTFDDAVDELDTLLGAAVRDCMVSDAPLGAFLSGGIDSSTIVALMQSVSARPVKTFSIGFHEDDFNEARHAAAVAAHLGTDHTELYVTAADAQAVIPTLPTMYDEPFADSSQIPTHLVSRLARESVTVSLSGDGGDELFGGYNRYLAGDRVARFNRWTPRVLRQALAAAVTAVPVAIWDGAATGVRPLLPRRFQIPQVGDKLHKLAGLLGANSGRDLYCEVCSQWNNPTAAIVGGFESESLFERADLWRGDDDLPHAMMLMDALTYLPDDILTKVDRASMAVALESRIPMLDHRVFDFAWSLPRDMKLAPDGGKSVLRHVLYRYAPRALFDRPKMGFGVPIGDWLRGDLRDWVESLLDAKLLREQGYFNPIEIRTVWEQHLSGKRDWQHRLWCVLMFQAWRVA
jgi:asparagine synthase (glutamine-hydrolysing)